MNDRSPVSPPLLGPWVRASLFGWLIGFGLIVLLGIAWDLMGGGAQFMIGIGMGTGVGYMQGQVAREWLGSAAPWVWATVIGMGTPFVLGDIAIAFGFGIEYSLPQWVTAGSLLAGVFQWWLLRAHFGRAWWWIPASVVGWTVPVGLIMLNDMGLAGAYAGTVRFLIALVFGGGILGAVTGGSFRLMLPQGGKAA